MKVLLKTKALVFFRFFVLSVLFVFLAHCGGAGGVLTTAITGGSDTGAGTAGNNASVEAAGEAETEAFDSGPVDLPVTIAKLDTPDVTKLVISAQSLDQSVNLPQSIRLLVAKQQYSVTDPTVAYAIVGSAGSVQSPTITPYVYLENATNSTSEFCEVDSDGSFTCAILGDLLDDLRLYASTTNDTTTASMSPPLYISVDELGTVTVGDTNSAQISAEFSLMTDNTGNYYLVIVNENGLSSLFRRNVSGTSLETIWDTNDAESSIIPTVIESVSSGLIVLYDQNGKFYQVEISSSSSASISSSFLTGSRPAYTLSSTVSEITTLNNSVNVADPGDTPGYRIQVVYPGSDATQSPSQVIAYYPQSVATDQTVGRIYGVNGFSGSETLGAVEYEITTFGLQSFVAAFGNSGGGIAVITDPNVDGCEIKCRGEINLDYANHDAEEFDDMGIATGELIPDNINHMMGSPYDSNFNYFVTLSGVYQYSNYRSSYSESHKYLSTNNHPVSITISQDGTLIAGCCLDSSGNHSICLYNQSNNDFDIVWQEDGDLCGPGAAPEINAVNNDVHFYDVLGQHRGLYENTNTSTYTDYYRIPPLSMGACGHEQLETLTSAGWDDFCPCWMSFEFDTGNTADCSGYYSECVSTGNNTSFADCFLYINYTYFCPGRSYGHRSCNLGSETSADDDGRRNSDGSLAE